tara:strand:+ start:1557 stop:1664 length:108 start_codon:yes stop_codon:yes gene_type:complete
MYNRVSAFISPTKFISTKAVGLVVNLKVKPIVDSF